MQNIRSLIVIFQRVYSILTGEQKRKIFFVFLSMMICSLLELLGVSTIYPLLDLMTNDADPKNNLFIGIIYFCFKDITYNKAVAIMCIMIMIVFAAKNIVALVCVYIQISYSASCKREIQTTMFESYLKRPYEFFVNNNSGEIIRGINGDTTAVYEILNDGFQIIAESLSIVLIGGYLLVTDIRIAFFVLLLALLCFLGVVLGFKEKLKTAGKEYLVLTARQFQYSSQAIIGIKEIIAMNRRDFFVKQYDDNSYDVQKIRIMNSFISACPDRVLEATFIIGFMGIIAGISIFGSINEVIPVIGAFAMGAIKILPAVSKISNRVNDIVYQQKGLENCYNNISEAREIDRKRQCNIEKKDRFSDKVCLVDELRIEGVSWQYSNKNEKIFDSMSLTIRRGESVAFIGASGAGKTTLADIILGVYSPQEGHIAIDGVDIRNLAGRWHELIGYVPQNSFLLDDSVRRNVAFGISDEEIMDDRVWDVLKQAQLKDLIEQLPQGLETKIGDRGIKFSGGQRQRLAIARALYSNPEILILDEATSALDIDTEKAVMEAIDSLHGYKTLIIVAHRLSTVRNCDKIYEIGGGKAVEVDKDVLFMNYNKEISERKDCEVL